MAARELASSGQRLTPKGQATRDRIVTAAARLMFDHGVAGTSTGDVEEAAGVSTSQIYHYFGDKKALVRAVITLQTEIVLNAQQPYLGRLDSMTALRAWRDHVVELQVARGCEGGCPIGALGSELAESDADARGEVAVGFGRWERAIRDGLHAMRDRGDLREDADPAQLALATLAALQGGLLLTQIRREPTPMAVALDAMLAHIESFTV